jgi:uncharacterized protein
VTENKNIVQAILSHPLFLLITGFALTTAVTIGGAASMGKIIPLIIPKGNPLGFLLAASVTAAACVLGYYLFTRFIERRPFADFGRDRAIPEFGYGLAVGAGAMALVVGVIAALGGYRIVGYNFSSVVLIETLAVAIISGIPEEIFLRGIVFRFLEKWLGSIAALALSALLFGFLHIGNPNASILAATAIAIEAGILLGAIYMVTRRLWAAIGLHMAWNSVQGGVFGIKVSGTDVKGLIVSQPNGSDWITGGLFGAEASLPAMVICTTIGLYFLWRAYNEDKFVYFSWQRFKTGDAPIVAPA